MKKFILFALIAGLTLVVVSCASSQASPEGAASEEASASGLVPVETKSSILFADGTLDEYVVSEYDDTLSRLKKQERYTASGALLEQVQYSYNDAGVLSEKTIKEPTAQIKNKVKYEYNEGKLQREQVFNSADKPISAYEYGYDAKGNRVSRAVVVFVSGSEQKMTTTYKYNGKGYLVSSETKSGSGEKISATENQYDNKGNLVGQKILDAAGKPSAIVKFTWQDGRETAQEQSGADGSVQMRITKEYGDEGELRKQTIKDLQGGSVQIFEYEYQFKPAGR